MSEDKKQKHPNHTNEKVKNQQTQEEIKQNTKSQEESCECEQKECAVSIAEYVRLKYQMAEVINKYNSLSHEFDNYRKRTKEETKQAKIDGQVKAIEAVLPALDSFKKARDIIKDPNCLSGIALIEKSLLSSLEKLGVKPIECIGSAFDPEIHNAVMLVEKDGVKSGTIVDEIEMGFMLHDKVVKYSQVIVAK